MKAIVLAAGQGTRLRPLTDDIPKCMVEINGISIIHRQINVMRECGIAEQDIYIVSGYRGDQLKKYFANSKINFLENSEYETTNMVCSLMCARGVIQEAYEILISYGDIIYSSEVLKRILVEDSLISTITDDGWYEYWKMRGEDPLEDAETLLKDQKGDLIEIGQKTTDISRIESQYIGLLKFKGEGIRMMLRLCDEAKRRSEKNLPLWRTTRTYSKMYMTDLLQGLIDEGSKIKAVGINRGWFEVDCYEDLKIAEKEVTF